MNIFWELRGFFRAHWRRYAVAGLMLTAVALLGLLPPAIVGRVVDGIHAQTLDARGLWLYAGAIVATALGIYVLRFLWRSAAHCAGRSTLTCSGCRRRRSVPFPPVT